MDDKQRRLLGDVARTARLRLGLTQSEVAERVMLQTGVYGRIERGGMTPSVNSLRRICTTLDLSSDELLCLSAPSIEKVKVRSKAPPPAVGEDPELSRIIHLLQDWPSERLALLRKLLGAADSVL
ncbi:helix-turn-helix domain-containing protein [Melittangium boletus]|nr:helix-turn-helix transcriptional regulator [Melittangium boletus]